MSSKPSSNAMKTRKMILAAAAELFETAGYENVTVDNIAAHISLTKGAVFHHFKSKKDLFKEIWIMVYDEMEVTVQQAVMRSIGTSDDPYAVFLAGIRQHVEYLQVPRYLNIVMRDGPKALGMDEWVELCAERGAKRLKLGLGYLIDIGALPGTDVDALSTILFGMLNYSAFALRDGADPNAHVKAVEQVLRGLPTGVKLSEPHLKSPVRETENI